MKSFATGKRCIPEFMKPKRLRRSQNGHPWEWDTSLNVQAHLKPFEKKVRDDVYVYHCAVLRKYLPASAFLEEDLRAQRHLSKRGREKIKDKLRENQMLTLPIVNKHKRRRRQGRKLMPGQHKSNIVLE